MVLNLSKVIELIVKEKGLRQEDLRVVVKRLSRVLQRRFMETMTISRPTTIRN